MTINLDFIAGVLCTFGSFSLCVIHVISSAKRGEWITLPEYVRVGFFATAMMLLYRGVNLITLAGIPDVGEPLRGRINAEGLMATMALTYTLCALAVCLARKAYPEGVWLSIARAEWIAKMFRRQPAPPYVVLNPQALRRRGGNHDKPGGRSDPRDRP
jgi:hypothetical protein